jgi:hypothetical protein
MKPQTPGLVILALVFTTALTLLARTQQSSQSSPLDSRSIAVNSLRILNTAEMRHFSNVHRFATIQEFDAAELNSSRSMYKQEMPLVNASAGQDAVSGFDLRITVSADGRNYAMSLKEKQRCGVSAFTDEAGVIYLAKALGCD